MTIGLFIYFNELSTLTLSGIVQVMHMMYKCIRTALEALYSSSVAKIQKNIFLEHIK